MSKLIITGSYDYADEFDYPVCSVITVDQRAVVLEVIGNVPFGADEYGFGTNESLFFEEYAIIDMLRKAQPISDEELKVLKKFGGTFGLDVIEQVVDKINYDNEDDADCSEMLDKLKSAFED